MNKMSLPNKSQMQAKLMMHKYQSKSNLVRGLTELELEIVNKNFKKNFNLKRIVVKVYEFKNEKYEKGELVFDIVVRDYSNIRSHRVKGYPSDKISVEILTSKEEELVGSTTMSFSAINLLATTSEGDDESDTQGILWCIDTLTGLTLELQVSVLSFELEEKRKGKFLGIFNSTSNTDEFDSILGMNRISKDQEESMLSRRNRNIDLSTIDEEIEGEEEKLAVNSKKEKTGKLVGLKERFERVNINVHNRRKTFTMSPLSIRNVIMDDSFFEDDDEKKEFSEENDDFVIPKLENNYVLVNNDDGVIAQTRKKIFKTVSAQAPRFHGTDELEFGKGIFKGGVKVVEGNPLPHGMEGEMKYDYFTYKGPFIDGKRHSIDSALGMAVLEEGGTKTKHSVGDKPLVVHIEFNCDKPDFSNVRIEYPNGDLYFGEVKFKDHRKPFECQKLRILQRHGIGFMYIRDDEICICGVFKEDVLGGSGIAEIPHIGHRVIGRWSENSGRVKGRCCITFIDGSFTHGEYKNGSRTSSANFVFSNGYQMKGYWNVSASQKNINTVLKKKIQNHNTQKPISGLLPDEIIQSGELVGHSNKNLLTTGISLDQNTLKILKDTTKRRELDAKNSNRIRKSSLFFSSKIWSPLVDFEILGKQISTLLKINIKIPEKQKKPKNKKYKRGFSFFSESTGETFDHLILGSKKKKEKKKMKFSSSSSSDKRISQSKKEMNEVSFVSDLVNLDGYLKTTNILFCNYINFYYGFYNSILSKKYYQMKKQFVHIKSDLKTYIQFLQSTIFEIIKDLSPNLASRHTNQMLYLTLMNFIHNRIYNVLYSYYSSKYELKEQSFKQKIQSIILALCSTDKFPKVLYCEKKCSQYLKKKKNRNNNNSIKSIDFLKLRILKKIVSIYKNIRESKNLNNSIKKEHIILNLLLESLNLKIKELKNCNFFHFNNNNNNNVLDVFLENNLKNFKLEKSEISVSSKSSFFVYRKNIKFLRITMECLNYHSSLNLLKKELLINFKNHSKFGYFNSLIKMLQNGFNYLKTGEFEKLKIHEINYLKTSIQSTIEYLNIFFRKKFEQPSLVRRSVNLRVKSISEGLFLISEIFPSSKNLVDELIEDLKQMSFGSRSVKHEKMILVFQKFKKIVYPLVESESEYESKSELPENENNRNNRNQIRQLFESMHFKLTGIMGLFGIEKYPIPINYSKGQIIIEIKSIVMFIQYLSLSLKKKKNNEVLLVNKNCELYLMIENYMEHLEIEMVKQIIPIKKNQDEQIIITKKNFEIIVEMKDYLTDILSIFNSMSPENLQFGKFNFLFDVLSVLKRGYSKIIEVLTSSGIKSQIFRKIKEVSKVSQHSRLLELILKKKDKYQSSSICSTIQSIEYFMKYILIKLEYNEMKNLLSSKNIKYIRKEFENQNEKYFKRFSNLCEDLIFSTIYHTVNSIPTKLVRFSLQFHKDFISLEALGVRPKFIPSSKYLSLTNFNVPYYKSIEILYKLKSKEGLLDKIRLLSDFEKTVKEEMTFISQKHPPFEEDDKLPVILYIFLMCPLNHVIESRFLRDWNSEEFSISRMIPRYETFMIYIKNLDPYVRDEGKEFLTIIGNIFSPLKAFLQQRIEMFKFLLFSETSESESDENNKNSLKSKSSHHPTTNSRNKSNNKNNKNNNNEFYNSEELNFCWLVKLLDYIYCTIGFLEFDEYKLRIDTQLTNYSSNLLFNDDEENPNKKSLKSSSSNYSNISSPPSSLSIPSSITYNNSFSDNNNNYNNNNNNNNDNDWAAKILKDLENCSSICQFLGFYIKYNSESDNLNIIFNRKYSPQIYRRIRKQITNDNFLREYVKPKNIKRN